VLDGSESISAVVTRTIATVIARAHPAKAANHGNILNYYH